MTKCLWLGGVFSSNALHENKAINQAANRWSLGLIKSLKNIGWTFVCLSHQPEQLWPKGRICPGDPRNFHLDVTPKLVRYLNLPIVREKTLPYLYLRHAKKYLVSKNKFFDVVVSYNPYPQNVKVGQWAHRNGVPWISITLDLKKPGKQMKNFSKLNRIAAGQVILSWWGFINSPLEPKIHLDGGYDSLHKDEADYSLEAEKLIVYSGNYSDYGGDEFLAEAISATYGDNLRFILLGKGTSPVIEKLVADDWRVQKLGFVSDAHLDHLLRKAHVLLNPRLSSFADNWMTFPSKLVFYLSFGKPVVSTLTPGVSPDYRPMLFVPSQETPRGFSQEIRKALTLSSEDREQLRSRIFLFLRASRSWQHQGEKFNNFYQNLFN